MKNNNQLIRRNNHFVAKDVDGKKVIFNLKNGNIFFFNQMATYIWQILKEPQTTEEIVKKISEKFVASELKASKDVKDFINQSIKDKLLLFKIDH